MSDTLSAFLDYLPDAVITIDHEQRIVQINRGAERMFGFTAAELYGQQIDVLLPEDHRQGHAHEVAAFLAGPETGRDMAGRKHIQGRRKGGEVFPAQASIVKQDGGERATRATAIVRDMTDEHAWRAQLAAAEAKQRAMLEASPDAILLIETASGCVAEANAHAAGLLDWQVADLIGTALEKLTPDDADGAASAALAAFARGQRRTLPEARLQRADGRIVTVEAAGRPATVNDQHLLVAFLRDISQWKSMEESLLEAREAAAASSRAKSTHVMKVSGDMRLAVDAIAGLADGLPDALWADGREPHARNARDIAHAATYLRRLIDDILALDAVDLENMPAASERLDLVAEIEQARRLAAAAAGTDPARIQVDAPASLPVEAEPVAMRRAIMTVIDNALRVSPADAAVAVDATIGNGGEATLRVTDRGPGIPEDKRARILAGEPEKQGFTTLTVKTIGLAMTRDLMRAHGGEMAIATDPERGTSVSLQLPARRVGWTGARSSRPA